MAAIESIPVCGVAIKKEVDAAFEAPWRLRDTAVGSTPHEHSGSGMPNRAAFTTGFMPEPERWRLIVDGFTNTWRKPAMINPNNI